MVDWSDCKPRRVWRIGLAMTLAGLLAACASGTNLPRYATIKPVYKIRNSPKPVPLPRPKPDPRRLAQASSQAAPARPARSLAASRSRRAEPAPSRRASAAAIRPRAMAGSYRVVSGGPLPRAKPTSATGVVMVRKGDTVYAIAQRNKVGVREVIAANRLSPPYTVHPGDRLAVPEARFHTVARGETGYGIAERYGVTLASLVRVNDLRPPYTLAVGQTLRLPSGAGQAQPAVVRRTVDLPDPPARSGQGFAWPVEGTIIASFGAKGGGLQNDGINIAAPAGTPVRATEAGTVVYAGDRLAGYGKLLLIRHAGGWVSAYAHNQRLLVSKGEQVRRRQIIAHVGQTGLVESPQLHFELRRNNRPVDPKSRLEQVTAAR
ncbi:murein DD-endopeptidase MepM/ murein hydrolase activator NlpD [Rhodothalassium salexigens DSM 2132]|uniref:Murein DD-endopeptidase MepM/ murein hydrolase activator NlpD n=1 Tax=Rhodothalassium salexigens DSM 2132 TaxID=1188247 RepID=A0A4R2PRM6_RHOSA|nr:M23 family metallopeptidase [Rhodothalassium salexigens]MBB4210335.1 murein DD-endopeptidase MepM/ murein hydrolase activator NlpD [Rhodothalassium salexigens DSM 2132]MBK1638876.1 hypothetical protein [Rhodothalassium salexigens DSM 2132]TCP38499.1 murein DD-endopeptidase MepM/ murein hydrolase activator NlpD [Rhodothalassium salexigens DSM 2132]